MVDTALQTIGTDLQLLSMGVPWYSARNLTQTITPIREITDNKNNIRRTINGALDDITPPEFYKYATRISSSDQRPPSIDGMWPGMAVTVVCVAYLAYPQGGSPQRPEVSGTVIVENGFVFYRPILSCRLMNFSMGEGEWTAGVRWEMSFEEI